MRQCAKHQWLFALIVQIAIDIFVQDINRRTNTTWESICGCEKQLNKRARAAERFQQVPYKGLLPFMLDISAQKI